MGRIYRPNFNRIQRDNDRFNNNKYKFNWYNIKEVRLIDQNGTMVGIVPTQQALQMAKEAELDLINISPNAIPPVCKIYDYGKYNYEKQKKQKDNKSSTKQKEIQFTINIGANDLDIKLKTEKLADHIKSVLSPREQLIIRLRYGLDGREPLTQREVAVLLKISRSYVSRIEKRALQLLKECYEAK